MSDSINQCLRRVRFAEEGIRPGRQRCLPHLWPSAQHHHPHSRADEAQYAQQPFGLKAGQIAVEDDQIRAGQSHLLHQVIKLSSFSRNHDFRILLQQ
jgi:hypothetical protein